MSITSRRPSHRRILAAAAVVGVGLISGCSSSATTSTSTAPAPSTSVAPSSTSAAPSTSSAPTSSSPSSTSTSSAPSTSTAPTSTAPGSAALLRLGGIGRFRFGDPEQASLDGLKALFGTASSDENRDYPTLQDDGTYLTADGEMGFTAPTGREVCWSTGFCAEFGGSADVGMTFAGWTYGGDTSGALHSNSGVTVGTRWSDSAAIRVTPGMCDGMGLGMADGIHLQLESSGAPFGSNPKKRDVTVFSMTAGDVPQFQFGDC